MIEKLKDILNKDKKTSNLILIAILLVVLLIATNYIFIEDDTKTVTSNNVTLDYSNDLESKLANIISKIDGVESADVMISYSTTEKVIPVYDVKENIDSVKEEVKESTKTTTEKTVAYETKNGSKEAIVESKETAEAIGAVVVITGNIKDSVKSSIKDAVSFATNIPIHKIQIFVN